MKISTRGRYALRVMIDLAEHDDNGHTPMKDVAARQELSLKYVERITPALTKASLIAGIHGKGGGYRLTKTPEEYSVREILEAAEGDLAPVACLSQDAPPCDRAQGCKTLPLWKGLQQVLLDYLDGITLKDLVEGGSMDEILDSIEKMAPDEER